jgi:hypothetical protein
MGHDSSESSHRRRLRLRAAVGEQLAVDQARDLLSRFCNHWRSGDSFSQAWQDALL